MKKLFLGINTQRATELKNKYKKLTTEDFILLALIQEKMKKSKIYEIEDKEFYFVFISEVQKEVPMFFESLGAIIEHFTKLERMGLIITEIFESQFSVLRFSDEVLNLWEQQKGGVERWKKYS